MSVEELQRFIADWREEASRISNVEYANALVNCAASIELSCEWAEVYRSVDEGVGVVSVYPSTQAIEAEIRLWWRRRHESSARWMRGYVRLILRGEIIRLRYLRSKEAAVLESPEEGA